LINERFRKKFKMENYTCLYRHIRITIEKGRKHDLDFTNKLICSYCSRDQS